ncbi:NHLP leader peptide family natural product precursor [Candidatus Methylospira mobilis]|uniref:NHLP leader peptide family natural product n=1 Tax=Candidatus Methylospira mobilis TaxID=1808979 RepID=A0A5Q0BP28_9GAMM|nr:NHLP leader peptide family RiPP precursor [Candidatus Methylospira mobilis]QFY43496.1 NHLP leader peptide family natural product precursor [Candidatus Methylospira mobilis]WNV03964.1 NHLP leader peptide family RiPP precursor [Candidatus Methylospira mobilis]
MNEAAAEKTPEYDEHEAQFAGLIAKCWADEAFKAKLLVNTVETLKEEGLAIKDGFTIKAVENTDSVYHLVIPEKPAELSDQELDEIVGGLSLRRIGDGIGRAAVTAKNHIVAGGIETKNHLQEAGRSFGRSFEKTDWSQFKPKLPKNWFYGHAPR